MSLNKLLTLLSGSLLCSSVVIAQADTVEKTTTTTTTFETVPAGTDTPAAVLPPAQPVASFVLPAENSYTVVDGKTGIILGNYDVAGRTLVGGQAIPSGALIVEKSSGRLVATVDAMGSIIDVYTTPVAPTLSTTIIDRRTRLYGMVSEAVAAGTLSKEQAALMRADLDKIAAETAAGAPPLTYGQAMLIGYNLDLFSDRLVPIVHTSPNFVPLVPPEFIVVGGKLSMVDKDTYRRVALERRINDEYKAGRLSAHDVSRLKAELDQVASLQSKHQGSNGHLSSSEQRKLTLRMDQVQASMDTDIAAINKKRSNIGIIVE